MAALILEKGYHSDPAGFEGWKTSPGHCANMMGGSYKDFAVAEYKGYRVMLLGSRNEGA